MSTNPSGDVYNDSKSAVSPLSETAEILSTPSSQLNTNAACYFPLSYRTNAAAVHASIGQSRSAGDIAGTVRDMQRSVLNPLAPSYHFSNSIAYSAETEEDSSHRSNSSNRNARNGGTDYHTIFDESRSIETLSVKRQPLVNMTPEQMRQRALNSSLHVESAPFLPPNKSVVSHASSSTASGIGRFAEIGGSPRSWTVNVSSTPILKSSFIDKGMTRSPRQNMDSHWSSATAGVGRDRDRAMCLNRGYAPESSANANIRDSRLNTSLDINSSFILSSIPPSLRGERVAVLRPTFESMPSSASLTHGGLSSTGSSPSFHAIPAQLRPIGQKRNRSRNIKVATFNIFFELGEGDGRYSVERLELIIRELETLDADVIGLQEVTPWFFSCIRAHSEMLRSQYYWTCIPDAVNDGRGKLLFTQIIMSRYPIIDAAFVKMEKPFKRCLFALIVKDVPTVGKTLDPKSEMFIVANCHLSSDYKRPLGAMASVREHECRCIFDALQSPAPLCTDLTKLRPAFDLSNVTDPSGNWMACREYPGGSTLPEVLRVWQEELLVRSLNSLSGDLEGGLAEGSSMPSMNSFPAIILGDFNFGDEFDENAHFEEHVLSRDFKDVYIVTGGRSRKDPMYTYDAHVNSLFIPKELPPSRFDRLLIRGFSPIGNRSLSLFGDRPTQVFVDANNCQSPDTASVTFGTPSELVSYPSPPQPTHSSPSQQVLGRTDEGGERAGTNVSAEGTTSTETMELSTSLPASLAGKVRVDLFPSDHFGLVCCIEKQMISPSLSALSYPLTEGVDGTMSTHTDENSDAWPQSSPGESFANVTIPSTAEKRLRRKQRQAFRAAARHAASSRSSSVTYSETSLVNDRSLSESQQDEPTGLEGANGVEQYTGWVMNCTDQSNMDTMESSESEVEEQTQEMKHITFSENVDETDDYTLQGNIPSLGTVVPCTGLGDNFFFKSFETALCIVPPPKICEKIDIIRSHYDKAYLRWMPHINLLFPFLHPAKLSTALSLISEALNSIPPFRLTLKRLGTFGGDDPSAKKVVIYLQPEGEGVNELISLQRRLQELFPLCIRHYTAKSVNLSDVMNPGKEKTATPPAPTFVPHLTVATINAFSKSERTIIEAWFKKNWQPVEFTVTRIQVLRVIGKECISQQSLSTQDGSKSEEPADESLLTRDSLRNLRRSERGSRSSSRDSQGGRSQLSGRSGSIGSKKSQEKATKEICKRKTMKKANMTKNNICGLYEVVEHVYLRGGRKEPLSDTSPQITCSAAYKSDVSSTSGTPVLKKKQIKSFALPATAVHITTITRAPALFHMVMEPNKAGEVYNPVNPLECWMASVSDRNLAREYPTHVSQQGALYHIPAVMFGRYLREWQMALSNADDAKPLLLDEVRDNTCYRLFVDIDINLVTSCNESVKDDSEKELMEATTGNCPVTSYLDIASTAAGIVSTPSPEKILRSREPVISPTVAPSKLTYRSLLYQICMETGVLFGVSKQDTAALIIFSYSPWEKECKTRGGDSATGSTVRSKIGYRMYFQRIFVNAGTHETYLLRLRKRIQRTIGAVPVDCEPGTTWNDIIGVSCASWPRNRLLGSVKLRGGMRRKYRFLGVYTAGNFRTNGFDVELSNIFRDNQALILFGQTIRAWQYAIESPLVTAGYSLDSLGQPAADQYNTVEKLVEVAPKSLSYVEATRHNPDHTGTADSAGLRALAGSEFRIDRYHVIVA